MNKIIILDTKVKNKLSVLCCTLKVIVIGYVVRMSESLSRGLSAC